MIRGRAGLALFVGAGLGLVGLGVVDGWMAAERLQLALAPGEAGVLIAAGALRGLALVGLALLAARGLSLASGRWPSAWVARGSGLGRAALLLGVALALLWPLREGRGAARLGRSDAVATGPDLVLLTLDTLRADHVGTIGGARRAVQTPALDRLAEQGLLFTRGVSPVPLTLPAHAAMLSGVHPLELGLLRNGLTVPMDAPLIAEALAARGYRTGAFVSAAVLRAKTGLARGFERYDDRFDLADRLAETGWGPLLRGLERLPRERRGDQTLDRALAWLAEGDGRPSFLWVHLYDCHAPYRPPAPYDRRYPWDLPDAQGNPADMREARELIRTQKLLFSPFVPIDMRAAVARYAGEVSYIDSLVDRLLQALPEATRLVVASDHGESLTEHGELSSHGSQLYDTTVRVPIWVRAPGLRARVEQPAPLDAVGRTLLALAGLDPGGLTLLDAATAPWPSLPLVSLAGTQQSRDAIPIQKGWEISLRDYNQKWISRKDARLELYAPEQDPGELQDLAPTAPAELTTAAAQLAGTLRARAISTSERHGPLDEETAEELRALGYSD